MAGIECSFAFSSLDQTARKINIGKFQHRKTNVMIVTDVAARGIDIPLLDNVINYNFPGKPKLFVHRVGRVARAGRSGTAYSLVGSDEVRINRLLQYGVYRVMNIYRKRRRFRPNFH
ncbi:PREDICTED: ATP-dependent RNA helicase DDX54-like [Acropora digitifera]|uniref:ATP-dependent RNA helicase DDX54-like n=1 Tax=Acropora digitifera TaxID=70779 RepID=UPI00077A48C6|nr:PREDICTED: ATP-dependent RNA helicase DDX54-like [Acropora digitifera]